jgi:hypothetical protein
MPCYENNDPPTLKEGGGLKIRRRNHKKNEEREPHVKRGQNLSKKGKTKEGWGKEMDTILINKINTKKTTIKLKKGSTDLRQILMITSLCVSPTLPTSMFHRS